MKTHSNLPTKSKFKMSLICAAVLNVFTAQAFAVEDEAGQNEPTSFSEATKLSDVEVIEVRGIRGSTEKNLSIKRLSNAMVDAITAEDIGKFPDKNVADSLQRVPGVVIQRDGGEGSTVSIRGLSSDLTYTQLNGNYIASSPGEPSRSFDYALLPAAMIETVEVYKSPEARIDEGGVGGTVLLKSRTPLNMDNGGIFQVETTYADVTEDYEPSFTGLYSWKNDDEDFGMLLGYTSQTRTNRSMSGSVQGWNWTGEGTGNDVNGNTVENDSFSAPVVDVDGNSYDNHWVPQVVRANVYEEEREREGIQATMQYAPTDNIEITANYFRFKLGLNSTSSSIDFPEWNLQSGHATNVTTDDSGTIITGIDYGAGATGDNSTIDLPWIRGEYTREESISDTYDFNVKYMGDEFELRFTAGHTEADGGPTEKYETAYYSGNSANGTNAASFGGWDISNQDMSIYLDPNMITNLHSGIGGGTDPGSSNSSFVTSEMEEDYVQLDLDHYIDYGILTMVRVGTKYRNSKIHRDTRNTFYLDPDFDIEAGEASEDGITRDDSYQWNGGMPPASDVILDNSVGTLPGGFHTNIFPAMNWNAYSSYLNDNYVQYTRVEDNFVYDVEEEIFSSYIQFDFEGDDFRGNFGTRYVQTTTMGSSTDIYVFQLDSYDDDENEINDTEDEWFLVEQENTYYNFLPSFNISYDLTDDIIIRAAVAEVMSRPDYSTLGGQERLTWTSDEWAADRSGQNVDPGWSGYGGNKNLKPFESFQQDISLEYYYGNGSAMGIAFFNKSVDNFVVPLVMDVYRDTPEYEVTIKGVTSTVGGDNQLIEDYSTSGNGSDATSRGIEVFLQHSFESGFGISTNYTYNDASESDVMVDGEKVATSKLIGSADFQFNFSAYFENDDFSVRASYNLRGDEVRGIQNGMNVYNAEYDQVDVNGSYQLSENLVFTASVINLLEEESYTFLGDDTEDRFLSNSYSGRRMYAGMTYNF